MALPFLLRLLVKTLKKYFGLHILFLDMLIGNDLRKLVSVGSLFGQRRSVPYNLSLLLESGICFQCQGFDVQLWHVQLLWAICL